MNISLFSFFTKKKKFINKCYKFINKHALLLQVNNQRATLF
jgi:hypothetical protein